MADGIRMYNELHLAPVAPISTFYLAPKGTVEYSAQFLQEPTADEFVRRLALAIQLPPTFFSRLFLRGPGNILIRVTDSVVTYMKPETVFQFEFRTTAEQQQQQTQQQQYQGGAPSCDVILEDVTATMNTPLASGATAAAAGDALGFDNHVLHNVLHPPPQIDDSNT